MKEARAEIKGKAARYAHVLREHLPELRERYGVESLGIFGSYVRGEEKEGSDLDVLVEVDQTRPFGFFAYIRLEQELSEMLDVKVDLVTQRALRARIGRQILREVVPV